MVMMRAVTIARQPRRKPGQRRATFERTRTIKLQLLVHSRRSASCRGGSGQNSHPISVPPELPLAPSISWPANAKKHQPLLKQECWNGPPQPSSVQLRAGAISRQILAVEAKRHRLRHGGAAHLLHRPGVQHQQEAALRWACSAVAQVLGVQRGMCAKGLARQGGTVPACRACPWHRLAARPTPTFSLAHLTPCMWPTRWLLGWLPAAAASTRNLPAATPTHPRPPPPPPTTTTHHHHHHPTHPPAPPIAARRRPLRPPPAAPQK